MNKRTKTKRAKPLNAGKSHELSHKPASATKISLCEGHGIAALAEMLADTYKLSIDMDQASVDVSQAMARSPETNEHFAREKDKELFEIVECTADDRGNALHNLIMTLEPTTASETLSLAVIFNHKLRLFFETRCDHEETRIGHEIRQLEHALKAIIRGLIHGAGASSPLLRAYTHPDSLLPWNAVRATAVLTAPRYRVGTKPDAGSASA